jgi:hypothetical protein
MTRSLTFRSGPSHNGVFRYPPSNSAQVALQHPRIPSRKPLREVRFGRGFGGPLYLPRHSARGPYLAPVLRAQPILLLEQRGAQPAAQSLPLKASAGVRQDRPEWPNFAPGQPVTSLPAKRTGTFRPSTSSYCNSSRKHAAGFHHPTGLLRRREGSSPVFWEARRLSTAGSEKRSGIGGRDRGAPLSDATHRD